MGARHLSVNFFDAKIKSSRSWEYLHWCMDLHQKGMSWKVGNGDNTSFWFDMII